MGGVVAEGPGAASGVADGGLEGVSPPKSAYFDWWILYGWADYPYIQTPILGALNHSCSPRIGGRGAVRQGLSHRCH
jgi:hypothetical protein